MNKEQGTHVKENNRKHAYCIIAHNEPEILATLIRLIDDERNDIFILIDKKAPQNITNHLATTRAGLNIIKPMSIDWGGLSLVKAEIEILRAAMANGPYIIYHIISGADLPIKDQDYIHHYVQQHPNTEFIAYSEGKTDLKDLERKTRYYHFCYTFTKHSNPLVCTLANVIDRLLIRIQRLMGIRRKYPYILKKGTNWCSITHDLCKFIISQSRDIVRIFNHTCAPDEFFIQSIAYSSPFVNHLHKTANMEKACMREIDWERGYPYVWGTEDTYSDLNYLLETDSFFARKFSAKHMGIVKMIEKHITDNRYETI